MDIEVLEPFLFTCRTCLATGSVETDFIDLDSSMMGSITFVDCLNFCTNLFACTGDDLPIHICIECRRMLEVCYDFVKKCKNSDSILRSMLTEDKVDDFNESFYKIEYMERSVSRDGEENSQESNGNDELFQSEHDEHDETTENHNDEYAVDITKEPLSITHQSEATNINEKKWSCEVCGCVFWSEESYENHLKEHCDKNITNDVSGDIEETQDGRKIKKKTDWVCKICSKRLTSRVYYEAHVNKHLGISPYKCRKCSYSTCYRNSLERHYKGKHNIDATADMLHPSVVFIDVEFEHKADQSLQSSVNELNANNVFFKCTFCPFKACSRSVTMNHLREEHQSTSNSKGKKYQCKECKKYFRAKHILKEHIKIVHPDGIQFKEMTTCNICGCECRVMMLDAHKRTHDSVPNKPKIQKKKEKVFLCSFCPKQFSEKHVLQLHELNTHESDAPKAFQCQECSSSFKCKDYLDRHKRTVHVQRKLKCEFCGRLFKLQFQLSAHLKRHTDRKYKCDECGKTYPRIVELKVHMRVHTGETPYKCTNCEESFSTSARLSVHFAAKHAIEKTKCPHCNKVFKGGKTSRYYTHMYHHMSHGLPYKCEKCTLQCETRYQMRRHMKAAHEIDISNKELIDMFHKSTGRYARADLQRLNKILKCNEKEEATNLSDSFGENTMEA